MTTPREPWLTHEVAPDLVAMVEREMPPLSASMEAQLDGIWQDAQARMGGALFNGHVFSVDTITPRRLGGHMTEFRRVVAQMDHPELSTTLAIRSLAVCGIVRCADGIVFGRRNKGAVYQAGMWQLPPAGSVDAGALRTDGTLDLRAQLLAELEEELGVPREAARDIAPVCMVEHAGSHVLDIAHLIRIDMRADAILTAHAARGNTEYEPLLVIPTEQLRSKVTAWGDTLVPTARIFLRRANLLPE